MRVVVVVVDRGELNWSGLVEGKAQPLNETPPYLHLSAPLFDPPPSFASHLFLAITPPHRAIHSHYYARYTATAWGYR